MAQTAADFRAQMMKYRDRGTIWLGGNPSEASAFGQDLLPPPSKRSPRTTELALSALLPSGSPRWSRPWLQQAAAQRGGHGDAAARRYDGSDPLRSVRVSGGTEASVLARKANFGSHCLIDGVLCEA